MKLDKLSASRIKTFEQCPMKYRAIYEEGYEETPHPLAVMGTCVHNGAERIVKEIIDGAEYSRISDKVTEECKKHSVSKENTELAVRLADNAVNWGYLRNLQDCAGVELEFNENLPDGTPVRGYIDRLDIHDDWADIIDLKTQKRAFDEDNLRSEWQSIIYNWGARRIHPEITGNARISYWVLRHWVQRCWMNADDAKHAEDELMKKAEEIRSCDSPEPNPSPLCKWCPKKPDCPYAGKLRNPKHRVKKK